MIDITIIESMKKWVSGFPLLDELAGGEIHIDLTEESDGSYGLELASDSCTEEYVDGSQLRTAQFFLYFRDATDFDVQRLENCQFCQNLIFWVRDKNRAEELPELEGDGEHTLSADSVSAQNGRLLYYDDSCTSGVYQIAIELTYFLQ